MFSITGDPLFFSGTRLQGQSGTAIASGDLSLGVTIDIFANSRTAYLMGAYDVNYPLPVKYTYLNANRINKDVSINWATFAEINNRGFAVERSFDGETFSEIEFAKGDINSNQIKQYSALDLDALNITHSSILYYRLKQIDFDGKIEYSKVVSVRRYLKEVSPIIYPNPFNNELGVKINTMYDSDVKISFFDVHGKEMYSQRYPLTLGENNILLDNLNILNIGMYYVRIQLKDDINTIFVIKSK